jgi:hypothetical protein
MVNLPFLDFHKPHSEIQKDKYIESDEHKKLDDKTIEIPRKPGEIVTEKELGNRYYKAGVEETSMNVYGTGLILFVIYYIMSK